LYSQLNIGSGRPRQPQGPSWLSHWLSQNLQFTYRRREMGGTVKSVKRTDGTTTHDDDDQQLHALLLHAFSAPTNY